MDGSGNKEGGKAECPVFRWDFLIDKAPNVIDNLRIAVRVEDPFAGADMVIILGGIVELDEPGLGPRKLVFIEPVYISLNLLNIDIRPVGKEALIDGVAIVLQVINIELFGIAFKKTRRRPAAGKAVKDGKLVPAELFHYILKAPVQEGQEAPLVADIGYKLGIEIGALEIDLFVLHMLSGRIIYQFVLNGSGRMGGTGISGHQGIRASISGISISGRIN
jgi:hypothetical protein